MQLVHGGDTEEVETNVVIVGMQMMLVALGDVWFPPQRLYTY